MIFYSFFKDKDYIFKVENPNFGLYCAIHKFISVISKSKFSILKKNGR